MGEGASSSAVRFCGECGQQVTTKFCTGCGTKMDGSTQFASTGTARSTPAGVFGSTPAAKSAELKPEEPTEIGSIVKEMAGDDRDSPINIALQFAAAPVRTILSLTADPTYKTQWRFMAACTGIALTFFLTLWPKLIHFEPPHAKSGHIIGQINQYVSYFVMTPLQYHLCRFAGGQAQTLRRYFKLCALSVGYTTLLLVAAHLGFYILTSILNALHIVLPAAVFWTLYYGLIYIPPTIFITLSHIKFWGFGVWRALAVTVALIFVTQFVLGSALDWAQKQMGLPELIEEVLS